jgi:alpha-1,6-mannosyltransferase
VVAGYLAMAVVAGAPNSPLTVLLPPGTEPPASATSLARVTGVVRVGRRGLIPISLVLMVAVLAAFAGVLTEAWANRVRLSAVIACSGISLGVSVAAPLLLSRDIYTYAAYGRIVALYGQNPYVVRLSSFPRDPFVARASVQWLHHHSLYGPGFTLVSAAIARAWAGSPAATILAFKVLAGSSIAAATGVVAVSANRVRPGRAPLAVALIGLNPVIVVHTVGGGHVDALLAAPLAAAMALAMTRPRGISARAIVVTVLLTGACLVKVVMVPALALWMWWIVRSGRAERGRIVALHLGVIAALVVAAAAPFVAAWHVLAAFATLGGIEVWASPSQLVGHVARLVVGSVAGSAAGGDAARVVEIAFLVLFLVLLRRLAHRAGSSTSAAPAEAWGIALLLLALCMPFLLPWYSAWFVGFLGIFGDEMLVVAGALVTGVLALTLIPADPFHGFSTTGVMDGVHYGAASILLVVLVVVAGRVLRGDRSLTDASDPLVVDPEGHGVGSASLR